MENFISLLSSILLKNNIEFKLIYFCIILYLYERVKLFQVYAYVITKNSKVELILISKYPIYKRQYCYLETE